MSRVAANPVPIPDSCKLSFEGHALKISNGKQDLLLNIHESVSVSEQDGQLVCAAKDETLQESRALSGTMRALIANMVEGLDKGFKKELVLVGVGYKANVSGKKLNLSLGFSHPVVYSIPDGIEIKTASATEIEISGVDKQLVGQVAADIRRYRPPEPYKGKGIRYKDEVVKRKEGKSK